MRIAIIGTRGIPNHYGGFEKSAQNIALGLVNKGHEVIVYNAHNHSYQKSSWEGIKLIYVHDSEYRIGALGNVLYVYNCIKDLKKRNCDIILQFGYSSAIWSWMLPKNLLVITNIFAMEWQRKRYNLVTSTFLKLAEKLAIRCSDSVISDGASIDHYLKKNYVKATKLIPHGVDLFTYKGDTFKEKDLEPNQYDLYVGSLESDYNIELILEGYLLAEIVRPFVVVGNHLTKYGDYLKHKYRGNNQIRFLGNIYDQDRLNRLRYFSNLYFYGNTVGGTSHLLLEAMAANCLISAHDNVFNRYLLGDDSFYFNNVKDIATQLQTVQDKKSLYSKQIQNNKLKIFKTYNWANIVNQYGDHFNVLLSNKKKSNAYSKRNTVVTISLEK